MTRNHLLALTALALFTTACAHAESSHTSAAPLTSAEPSPTETDPDKYKIVFENERVRVLRYHDVPGAKTAQHHHPDSLLYALGSFRRRLTFPDGKTKDLQVEAGTSVWVPAQTHVGENVGATDTDVLLVEPKSR